MSISPVPSRTLSLHFLCIYAKLNCSTLLCKTELEHLTISCVFASALKFMAWVLLLESLITLLIDIHITT